MQADAIIISAAKLVAALQSIPHDTAMSFPFREDSKLTTTISRLGASSIDNETGTFSDAGIIPQFSHIYFLPSLIVLRHCGFNTAISIPAISAAIPTTGTAIALVSITVPWFDSYLSASAITAH